MKCQYCGEELTGGRFCTNCGSPIPDMTDRTVVPATPTALADAASPWQASAMPTAPAKPKKKKVKKILLIIAVILAVLLVGVLVLEVLLNKKDTQNAQLLAQYAESKAWVDECAPELRNDDHIFSTEKIRYYLSDFDNDGWTEMAITIFGDWGKQAQCLLYAVIDGEVTLWQMHSYEADDDSGIYIDDMDLAALEGYAGLAVQFTINDSDLYLSVLQLDSDGLTEVDAMSGTQECRDYMERNGWQGISGTVITVQDGNRITCLAPEELAALAELYVPEDVDLELEATFLRVDDVVYATDNTAFYRFLDGQKQLICRAPENTIFPFAPAYTFCDGSFYLLGQTGQPVEDRETVVVRIDLSTETAETLFTIPQGEGIPKADGQLIYVQSYTSYERMGMVTVYDLQGSIVKTIATPHSWDSNGSLVLGCDDEGSCSVVTADGRYLLENVPAQSVLLTDSGVYYLLSDDNEATLHYADAETPDTVVGSLPLSSNARLTKKNGSPMVIVSGDDEESITEYSVPELNCVYSGIADLYRIPEDWRYLSWDITDAATGIVYIASHMAPHGNCGPLYHLPEEGPAEVVREPDSEIFYWLIYDGMIYYTVKDFSETQFYVEAPMVSGCMPLA